MKKFILEIYNRLQLGDWCLYPIDSFAMFLDFVKNSELQRVYFKLFIQVFNV